MLYGTGVEHRIRTKSLLNRSGIFNFVTELTVVFVHTAVVSVTKNSIYLGKYTFIFRYSAIDSVKRKYFCRPCCYFIVFWKAEIYTPSVFRIYADVHD